jgi:DNA-binding response OmpR family regulator
MGATGTRHKLPETGSRSAARPCVVISEPRGGGETPLATQLGAEPWEVVWCNEDQDVLDQVIQRRPQALVFALAADVQRDLALLFLLRRVAPAVPLVLVAAAASLETQRMIQELRPTYYVVRPVDRAELHEAIAAAIAQQARRPVV